MYFSVCQCAFTEGNFYIVLRKHFILAFAALCLLTADAQVATATTAIQPSDVELVVSARAIVTGEVTEITTAVHNGMVYSYIRLKVDEVLKGNGLASDLVLKQPGGEAGDLGTLIYGMPRFEIGKKVLLYLDTWNDGALRVHQWFLGKFDIRQDPSSAEPIVVRDEMEGASVRLHTGTVSTRLAFLSSYKTLVTQLLAENAERSRTFERETYGNLIMLAQPSEFETAYKRGQSVPQWVSINPPQPPRWFEADSNQTIPFYVNSAGAPAGVSDDVAEALNTWTQATGSSLRLALMGETTSCGINNSDGRNSISFNNCDNYFSRTDGCSGILGTGGIIRYIPSQSKVINGQTFYKALEGKVSMNPYGLCNIVNRCDLQEVITHEIGHALGLGHSEDDTATMFAVVHFDNRCSYLLGDDVQGIRFLYPPQASGGNLSIQTGAQLPIATRNLSYTLRLDVTGGSGNYSWSLTSGRLPGGLRLTTNGSVLGEPNESGNFDFAVQVRDTSGRTTQSSFTLTVRDSSAYPAISRVEYKKKKVFIYGSNFSVSGAVYLDGAQIFASIGEVKATTEKRKLKAGVHEVYILNIDGKLSNRYNFTIE